MPGDSPPSPVDGSQRDLQDRVIELERRLALLEQELSHRHRDTTQREHTVNAPVAVESRVPPMLPNAAEVVLRDSRPTVASRIETSGPTVPPPLPPTISSPELPPTAPTVDLTNQPESVVSNRPGALEQVVGGRWYAVLGALAVTIGIGLFVKLAYDEGWLRIAPVWRCLAGAGFGITLIGIAEWIKKRFGAWAAFGSYSAGLGAVYVSAYLAYRLYALIDGPATFVLLGAVAVGGLAISVRARLQAVGIASLVGGYLAPFLISKAPHMPLALPAYTLMLQAIGMGLVAWRLGQYRAVRQVVTWMTMVLGLFWMLGDGWRAGWWTQAFLAAAWCITHAELAWTAVRLTSIPGRAPGWFKHAGVSMLASLGVTAWWVGLGTLHAEHSGLLEMWLVPLVACAAALMLALLVSGSGVVIGRASTTTRETLGQALAAASAALLALTITLALDGPGEVVSWLALGTAACVIGWRLRTLSVRVYAGVLLGIGTARLVLYDWRTTMHASGVVLGDMTLTAWSLMMALASISWLVFVWTRRNRVPARIADDVAATVAALLPLFASVLHPDTSVVTIAWAWMGMAVVIAACRGTAAMPLDYAAAISVAWPCAAWVARVVRSSVEAKLLPYDASTSVQGLVIGAAVIGIAARARYWRGRERMLEVSALGGGLIAFAASCLGIAAVVISVTDDLLARRAAISLWWGIVAAGLLFVGFKRSIPGVRHAGLSLLGAAGLKVVTFDLAEVSPAWRIASFLVLGLLMLGVALAYGRVSAKARQATSPNEKPTA